MTDADGADWPFDNNAIVDFLEMTMTPDPLGRLRRRRDRTETHLAHLDEQIRMLEQFPGQDPYEDGDVVRFELEWGGQVYTYAAVRAGGRWYTTATQGAGRVHTSWLAFVEWMTKATTIVAFEKMVPQLDPPLLVADPYGPLYPGGPFPVANDCLETRRGQVHLPHRWNQSGSETVFVCDGCAGVVPTVANLGEGGEPA